MATRAKNLPRNNDWYPINDVEAKNGINYTLNPGDVVYLDWTSVGDDNTVLAGNTNALLTTHVKCVCMGSTNQGGTVAYNTVGQFRIQGPCNIAVQTGQVFTKGDPIALTLATNASLPSAATPIAVTAPGTNNTYLPMTVGASLITTASSSSAQTMACYFDGTEIGAIYFKD